MQCTQCQQGWLYLITGPVGSSSPTECICPAGRYGGIKDNYWQCNECPVSSTSLQGTIGVHKCMCNANYYGIIPQGYVAPSYGSTPCVFCGLDKNSPINSTSATSCTCNAGYFVPNPPPLDQWGGLLRDNCKLLQACSTGRCVQITSDGQNSFCVECPVGKYTGSTATVCSGDCHRVRCDAPACIPCPPGMTTASNSSGAISQCQLQGSPCHSLMHDVKHACLNRYLLPSATAHPRE